MNNNDDNLPDNNDELTEVTDFIFKVNADDEVIEALRAGRPIEDAEADDLLATLIAWRQDVLRDPMPPIISPEGVLPAEEAPDED